MEKIIQSLNILKELKTFFETNKISTLLYLVFTSVCVVLILHLDLTWAYYFLAITAPALLTKVSMQGIDFVSPTVIKNLRRLTINRKLKNLKDYEKELIKLFVKADDTVMTLDKNYKCEGLILRGVLFVHETYVDNNLIGEERFKTDRVLVEMDRKAFIQVVNKPHLLE